MPKVELSQHILRGQKKKPAVSIKPCLIDPCPTAFPKTFKGERGVFVVRARKEQNSAVNADITGSLACQQAFIGYPPYAKEKISPGLLMVSSCQSSSNSD